jgi:hypothetical protein
MAAAIIKVVCTDRGQHAQIVLCHLEEVDGKVVAVDKRAEAFNDQISNGTPGAGPAIGHTWSAHFRTLPGGMEIFCTRCPQRHRIKSARLRILYDGLLAAGEHKVDIAYLA